MAKNFFRSSSNFLTRRQTNILSAAAVIMIMLAASRFLGLIRNRVLAHFFSAEILAFYFAAFRLPETVFEVLIFGTLSSAFIPTFTAYLSQKQKEEAWYIAAVCLNFAVLIFAFFAAFIFIFANSFYDLIAPGFSQEGRLLIVGLTRVLILAQGFFVISYFLTAVLESLQRFLFPALAPIFYNLGIILGAVFLNSRLGIYAPAIGAVIGAGLHFLIQLPLAVHLGFRPQRVLNFSHPGVREIARLAFPRMVELSFLQLQKTAELFLASLVSTAAYTYYTLANSLQLVPIGLFGASIAKASLPALSQHSAKGEESQFKQTFISSAGEILFLSLPTSVFLAVLRIPVVRLAFGASKFTWKSTVQTSEVLSLFCLSIFAQSLIYLLNRAFYAWRDTITPVKVSIISLLSSIFLAGVFILGLKWPIWGLALAFSLASIGQVLILFLLLWKKFDQLEKKQLTTSFLKISLASLISGLTMFFFLKILDRSVWDKKLSFLGVFGLALPATLDRLVLDTRYTFNLIALTLIVSLFGFLTYLTAAWLLKIKEIAVFIRLLQKIGKMPTKPEQDESVMADFDD